MNKNRIAVIIAVLFTIVVLVGGWFYLQYVMDNYNDEPIEDSNAATYQIDDPFSPSI